MDDHSFYSATVSTYMFSLFLSSLADETSGPETPKPAAPDGVDDEMIGDCALCVRSLVTAFLRPGTSHFIDCQDVQSQVILQCIWNGTSNFMFSTYPQQ